MESSIQENIIDVDLSPIKRKKIRINGDDNKILELNVADINIVDRVNDSYAKLFELAKEIQERMVNFADGSEESKNVKKRLNDRMKEYLDYIFNAPVSALLGDDGSLYDLFDGEFRFNHICDKLFPLYTENISKELDLASERIKKHTQKYV